MYFSTCCNFKLLFSMAQYCPRGSFCHCCCFIFLESNNHDHFSNLDTLFILSVIYLCTFIGRGLAHSIYEGQRTSCRCQCSPSTWTQGQTGGQVQQQAAFPTQHPPWCYFFLLWRLYPGSGDMAQWLRAYTGLPEYSGSVPITHVS